MLFRSNAPLFDQLLNGLNVTGVGVVGTNGITGSSALRRFTTTNQFIANGQVGALANYVNTTANLAGLPGGLLRNGKLPENFIVVNPQFGSVGLVSNNGNSTYHSFTAHIQKRLTNGLTGQASYVFSKNLGDAAIRDQNNLRLSKTLLANDRPHVIQEDVSYNLPFGKGAKYFTNAPGWLDQIVGGWNLASGANWSSGSPLTFTGLNTLNQFGTGTADLVGALPADYQQIAKIGNQVNYFPSLTTATVAQRPGILPNFGTGADAATLAGRFTNQVVVDGSGNVVIANSAPGKAGNTAINMAGLRGPGQLSFNGALGKEIGRAHV